MTSDSLGAPLVDRKQERYEQLEVQYAGKSIAKLTLSGVDNGKMSYRTVLHEMEEEHWESLCDTPTFTNDATFIDLYSNDVIPANSVALVYSSPGWVNIYLSNPSGSFLRGAAELLINFMEKVLR